MGVGNGETCYFWSSNWSPFGSITKYLRGHSTRNTGIPITATLAELWEQGAWKLPPARSEAHVIIQSYLSTIELTNEADTYHWLEKFKTPHHSRLLALLGWQAAIYCLWAERNSRLHRSRFRIPADVNKEIHTIIKLRIAAIRIGNPQLASDLFQAWHS
ncbi:unnamed protein product [Brassica napus]|uniref:(rape) hypothetical protein n=1 Tax=Brassica napus TaxID=3708 RepID=A0A816P177_BRANA|nr:unnamed protein product [Brassica napus]